MSRPAGATSLPRYIDLDTTRSTSSSAIGCACAATLAKLRYGCFQTDSTTLSHRLTSTCINLWFQVSCDLLGLRPPQGEKWVGHSHRSGGTTDALSIDSSLPAINCFGVWDHMGSLQAYLDASVGLSADTLLFFEHLLKPSLTAVRDQLSAQRAQAQGLPSTYHSVLLGSA
jgi:hypothetical protein